MNLKSFESSYLTSATADAIGAQLPEIIWIGLPLENIPSGGQHQMRRSHSLKNDWKISEASSIRITNSENTSPGNLCDAESQNTNKRQKNTKKIIFKAFHYWCNILLCKLVPHILLIIGILLSVIGWCKDVDLMVSFGCVLSIAAAGLTLQGCFWSRSQPNGFSTAEILRVSAMNEVAGLTKLATDENADTNEKMSSLTKSLSLDSLTDNVRENNSQLKHVRRFSQAMMRAATELREANQVGVTYGSHRGLTSLTFEGGSAGYPMTYDSVLNWHDHGGYYRYSSTGTQRLRRLSQWQNIM